MSDDSDLSEILHELAEGRIDAAEASRRIDAMKADPTNEASTSEEWAHDTGRSQRPGTAREVFADDDAAPEEPETPQRKAGTAKGIERVSVHAVGRRVRIVGERGVATASADGQHVLRRSGKVLEISSDGEIGASIDGFTLLRPPRSLDDLRNLGLGKELFIRVNPNVVVDVEVTAGRLVTENVPYLGKVRVTAGGARIEGVEEISDALIQAGQATIKGTITTGRSRIRSESGSLHVQLEDDSNVTVRAESQLGRVVWTGGHSGAGDEVVMGNGSARLDVGVVMGQARIKVGSAPREDGSDD